MQQASQQSFRQYVLAGNRIIQRDLIAVSPRVFVQNSGETDQRSPYRAQDASREPFGIPFMWTLAVLAIAIFLALFMVGSRIALTEKLAGEYSHLRDRYAAAEQERQKLLTEFNEKSDASSICYYAVQSLGMRLATNEETIGVQAARMPLALEVESFRGSASGAH